MQNAAFSRSEKSWVLASVQGDLGFPAASKQMRRLFVPRGGAGRQDVLVAANIDLSSEAGTDFEAWVAYREAKKKSWKKKREDGDARKNAGKAKGGGQTLNGYTRETGSRNRRYRHDSEYPLAPRSP